MSYHGEKARRQRDETRDIEVPATGPAKTLRVDLGLELLMRRAKPGCGLTLQDIAAWAGCTRDAILVTEQKALKKLRHKIRFGSSCRLGRELA